MLGRKFYLEELENKWQPRGGRLDIEEGGDPWAKTQRKWKNELCQDLEEVHSAKREKQGPRLWGENKLDMFQARESCWGWSPGRGKRGKKWASRRRKGHVTKGLIGPSKDLIIDSKCEGKPFNYIYLFLCFLARKWFDLISFLKNACNCYRRNRGCVSWCKRWQGLVVEKGEEKKKKKPRLTREEVTTLISSKEMAGA